MPEENRTLKFRAIEIRRQGVISFVAREEEGEEKFEFEFRFRREMSKEDGEGERERFNTLNLVYGRRVKSISAPCSIICPAFISSFRDRDCTSSAMPFAPAANFTSQHFARIYDHFPGYLRIVISQRFSHSKISFTSENVFIYTFDIISNKILILDINFKK